MAWALLTLLCSMVLAANHGGIYSNPWCWEDRVCTENAQCKQANGVSGSCCLGRCRNLKLSRGELCGSSLPAGCPGCDGNLNCVDAGSGAQRCQQQDLSNGCACNGTVKNCISTQPCLPSGLCGPKDVTRGGRCEVTAQCHANAICNASGVCSAIANGQGCGAPGADNLCLPQSVCGDDSKCTVIALNVGDRCDVDYECAQPRMWCQNKACANRTSLGGNCTGLTCEVGALCNSGICVSPRTVASNADCTEEGACVSGDCSGGKCTRTHFATAGQACTADLDCPFGASCSAAKTCTTSGLGTSCDPTLGGSDMDKQCQASNDLYCACSGLCLATADAIVPVGAPSTDCDSAKDLVSRLKLDDLKKIDISGLSAEARTAIATDQCCRNCNKDTRTSQIGVSIDCTSKSLSKPADSCDVLGLDALALANCPTRQASQQGSASVVAPMLGMLSLLGVFM